MAHSAIPITNIDWIAFITTVKNKGGGSKLPPYKYYVTFCKKAGRSY